jgi:hypothetical protein
MGGMSAAGGSLGTLQRPELGLAFVLVMAGWAVWDLNQLASLPAGAVAATPAGGGSVTRILLAPRVATGSRIAMGITMALMLILLI